METATMEPKHDQSKGRPKGKAPLTAAMQRKLRNFIRSAGEGAAAAVLELGEKTMLRAAAGRDVRRGSAALIETKLAIYNEDGTPRGQEGVGS